MNLTNLNIHFLVKRPKMMFE